MIYCEGRRNPGEPDSFWGDETMNQVAIIQDCLPCIIWNLFVPALAWALVIAGLTWTIRLRMRDGQPGSHLECGHGECPASGSGRVPQHPFKSAFCCGLLASSQPSRRGEETCTQKK
jgi:hypothetical protein